MRILLPLVEQLCVLRIVRNALFRFEDANVCREAQYTRVCFSLDNSANLNSIEITDKNSLVPFGSGRCVTTFAAHLRTTPA